MSILIVIDVDLVKAFDTISHTVNIKPNVNTPGPKVEPVLGIGNSGMG